MMGNVSAYSCMLSSWNFFFENLPREKYRSGVYTCPSHPSYRHELVPMKIFRSARVRILAARLWRSNAGTLSKRLACEGIGSHEHYCAEASKARTRASDRRQCPNQEHPPGGLASYVTNPDVHRCPPQMSCPKEHRILNCLILQGILLEDFSLVWTSEDICPTGLRPQYLRSSLRSRERVKSKPPAQVLGGGREHP